MKSRLKPPLDATRLRAIWKASPKDSSERELLLEIARLHHLLIMVRRSVDATEQAWREEVGGKLAAIHHLRCLLDDEPAVADWRLSVPCQDSELPLP